MNNELYHHGIKGMKWGVRRYQNPDGSLTKKGKKKISKEYAKVANKVASKLSESNTKRYAEAYNKAADYMNEGGIDKFNKFQKKKYGDNFAKRKGYESDYAKVFNEHLSKIYNKSLSDFYKNDSDYKKSKELVDKYKMTEWDDLAKTNENMVNELKEIVDKY